MSVNFTPKTWTAGSPLLATELNTDVRDLSSGLQSAWTAYTPTRTGYTLGNGSEVARYQRIGKTVLVRYTFIAGSTSAFTAAMNVGLPVSPSATYVNEEAVGAAGLNDASVASSRRSATVCISSTGLFMLVDNLSTLAIVASTVPWTWDTGDRFTMSATYEAA